MTKKECYEQSIFTVHMITILAFKVSNASVVPSFFFYSDDLRVLNASFEKHYTSADLKKKIIQYNKDLLH